LEESSQRFGGVGALDVLLDADLGALVGTGLGSQHVLGLGVEGVDLALVLLEKAGHAGLFDGQRFLGPGGHVTDQQFTTVGDVDGGDGVEKGVDFHDGLGIGVTASTATAEFGQEKTFAGEGQGSQGGDSDGHLGGGEDVGGGADGEGQGVEGGDDGQGSGAKG